MSEQSAIRLRLHKETLRRIEPVFDEAGKLLSWVPTTISWRPDCPSTQCPTDP